MLVTDTSAKPNIMKVEKLRFSDFKQNSLSFTSLKNLVGGARFTDYQRPGDKGDYVNDKEETRFDCDDSTYNDSCGE